MNYSVLRKIIAVIEIVSGFFVLGLFLFMAGVLWAQIANAPAQQVNQLIWKIVLFIAISVFFGLLNLFAGWKLWKDRKSGYIASFVTQALQIFSVQTPSFLYLFYTLIGIIIGASSSGFGSTYSFGASYLVSLQPQPIKVVFIGVNLFALLLFVLLVILYRKDKKRAAF